MVCKFSELFETPCTYESFKHGTHRCLCYFLNVASKVIQKRISVIPQRINWLRGQFLITWGRCKQETDNRRRTRKQMTHKQQHLTSAHVTHLYCKLLVDIETCAVPRGHHLTSQFKTSFRFLALIWATRETSIQTNWFRRPNFPPPNIR